MLDVLSQVTILRHSSSLICHTQDANLHYHCHYRRKEIHATRSNEIVYFVISHAMRSFNNTCTFALKGNIPTVANITTRHSCKMSTDFCSILMRRTFSIYHKTAATYFFEITFLSLEYFYCLVVIVILMFSKFSFHYHPLSDLNLKISLVVVPISSRSTDEKRLVMQQQLSWAKRSTPAK